MFLHLYVIIKDILHLRLIKVQKFLKFQLLQLPFLKIIKIY